jgi:hypothetical protein
MSHRTSGEVRAGDGGGRMGWSPRRSLLGCLGQDAKCGDGALPLLLRTARCYVCSGVGAQGDGQLCVIGGGSVKCTHYTGDVMGSARVQGPLLTGPAMDTRLVTANGSCFGSPYFQGMAEARRSFA